MNEDYKEDLISEILFSVTDEFLIDQLTDMREDLYEMAYYYLKKLDDDKLINMFLLVYEDHLNKNEDQHQIRNFHGWGCL